MIDDNGCSRGETDGSCFSDEVGCSSCGGKVNIGGSEVNRGCGSGADGSGCKTEADDDGYGEVVVEMRLKVAIIKISLMVVAVEVR